MMYKFVHAFISYLFLIIVVLFIGAPCLLFMLLPARWRYDNKVFFWFSNIFYAAALKATMVPITVVGKENLPKDPAIIVANHQSALDIPLIGALMRGFPHIWLAKSELSRSWLAPILNRMAVLVDVKTPQSAVRSLLKALDLIIDRQRHAIIFPEGGRHVDGNIVHEFFSGFVILARRSKRPVVPILILNAYKVYPPGSIFITRYPIKVVVGKPFYIKEGEEASAFKDRVYRWFVQQVELSEN